MKEAINILDYLDGLCTDRNQVKLLLEDLSALGLLDINDFSSIEKVKELLREDSE